MLLYFAALAGQVAQAALPAESAAFNPRANELFDRDSTLRSWAVQKFDTNGDGWLTLYEAQPAIAAFRAIADGNSDGRITTYEYRQAKEFIVARWAPGLALK